MYGLPTFRPDARSGRVRIVSSHLPIFTRASLSLSLSRLSPIYRESTVKLSARLYHTMLHFDRASARRGKVSLRELEWQTVRASDSVVLTTM